VLALAHEVRDETGLRRQDRSAPSHQEVRLLSLARRPGQKIRIGEDIILVVREIRGRQVKIGIEAPAHVRVLREEIYEELCSANRDAVLAKGPIPEAIVHLFKTRNTAP
jgi:carbon storage regulator CsrA